jgi:hypothetical protein
MKTRTKRGLGFLILVIALSSGALGFYFGIGQGAHVIGTLDSQNRVSEALSEVRTSVAALKAEDQASARRKVAIDLRVALFAIDTYSSAVPFWRCSERDREALTSAADYMADHSDPKIVNSAPELVRSLKFCAGR